MQIRLEVFTQSC